MELRHLSTVVLGILILSWSLLVLGSEDIAGDDHPFPIRPNLPLPPANKTRPSEYPLDTAKVRVLVFNATQSKKETYDVWGINTACYKCALLPQIYNATDSPKYLQIETNFDFKFQLRKNFTETIDSSHSNWISLSSTDTEAELDFLHKFGDRGVYTVVFYQKTPGVWAAFVVEDRAPYKFYVPIVVAFCIGFAAVCVYLVALLMYRKYMGSEVPEESPLLPKENEAQNKAEQAKLKSRVGSLDAFRGTCITIMIFVNYGGGGYWFFDHSYWNGLTVADLVFPWFIWIMGTSMALSFRSLETRNEPRTAVLYKVFRRAVILFALGLFLNNGQDLYDWRIPGVLQRFGVSYLAVSLIVIFIPKLGGNPTVEQGRQNPRLSISVNSPSSPRAPNRSGSAFFTLGVLRDVLPYTLQWLVALCCPLIWLLITFLLKVPGCPTGYLGPGGLNDDGKHWHCTGGAAGYLDKKIYGERHIYQWPTCGPVYQTGPYDPEGFLGNFTSIFLCFLGLQSGRILVHYKSSVSRIARWLFWGILCGLIATILCKGQQNGGWIPINKNLWSLSFVLVMAGTGFIVLAAYYFIIDVRRWWNGSPFRFVGMNSILLYCCHEILQGYFPFSYQTANTHAAQLAMNLIGVSCWVIIAFRMYQLEFFVNI